ncbi:uncharacterized protein DUF2809 [Mobilisporobacter senegalensis]|uniref:Uncharacterized protein DUF2809 n=1 Tax=Mobilisporobacter senegalensis TaxID=1329262 RepID=A0A3N1X9L4_9FIRM|nr:uncharacterized protein DUF2809 [Mobilisporobacter senegalensis]
MIKKHRKRIINFLIFATLFVIEILIAVYVHDNFVRPYLGDVLVVALLYFFIRIIIPEKTRFLSIYIYLFAVAIEFMQYINLVTILGLENNRFARIIIGSTFDWMDILCYGVGAILLLGGDMIANQHKWQNGEAHGLK